MDCVSVLRLFWKVQIKWNQISLPSLMQKAFSTRNQLNHSWCWALVEPMLTSDYKNMTSLLSSKLLRRHTFLLYYFPHLFPWPFTTFNPPCILSLRCSWHFPLMTLMGSLGLPVHYFLWESWFGPCTEGMSYSQCRRYVHLLQRASASKPSHAKAALQLTRQYSFLETDGLSKIKTP